MVVFVFFFQAEDGIRDLVRSRGLGDVYKRQSDSIGQVLIEYDKIETAIGSIQDKPCLGNCSGYRQFDLIVPGTQAQLCLLYTSDAADERSSVDLGGRRIIKKKKNTDTSGHGVVTSFTEIHEPRS